MKRFTLAALALALAAVLSPLQAGQFPSVHLDISHGNPRTPDGQFEKFASLFAEKVTAKSGGAVTCEIYGDSQLGGERDVIEGMKMGTMDAAILTNAMIAAVNDPSFIIELPFVFEDRAAVARFLDSDIAKEIYQSVYDNLDIKILGWAEGGFRNILNNIRPFRSPADAAGIKLRVMESPIFVDTFSSLGFNPVPIAWPETYTAIQQGTADGLELPIPSTYVSRYHEIIKYMSMTRHFYNCIFMCVSKSLWESLPPELQDIFVEAAVEAGREQVVFVEKNDQRMVKEMIAAGMQVNDDVDYEASFNAVQPVWAKYKDIIGAELYDRSIKFISEK